MGIRLYVFQVFDTYACVCVLFLQKLGDVLYITQLVTIIHQQGYCQWSTGIHEHA